MVTETKIKMKNLSKSKVIDEKIAAQLGYEYKLLDDVPRKPEN